MPKTSRKGIVLLSTIGLIMLLSLAILKSATVTEKYFYGVNQTIFFAQKNRFFLDVVKILETKMEEVDSADSFNQIVGMPILLRDDQSDLEGSLNLKSGATLLDINLLVDDESKINQTFYDFLERVLMEYSLRDMHFFLITLVDALDSDDEPRVFESELANENPRFNDGKIQSYSAFRSILDYYAKIRDDKVIYDVAWEDIIGFKESKTDINYITPRLREYLESFYGFNFHYNEDDIIDSKEALESLVFDTSVLDALGITHYVPLLTCKMEFSIMERTMQINFNYDLHTKRVGAIETTF